MYIILVLLLIISFPTFFFCWHLVLDCIILFWLQFNFIKFVIIYFFNAFLGQIFILFVFNFFYFVKILQPFFIFHLLVNWWNFPIIRKLACNLLYLFHFLVIFHQIFLFFFYFFLILLNIIHFIFINLV